MLHFLLCGSQNPITLKSLIPLGICYLRFSVHLFVHALILSQSLFLSPGALLERFCAFDESSNFFNLKS